MNVDENGFEPEYSDFSRSFGYLLEKLARFEEGRLESITIPMVPAPPIPTVQEPKG